MLRASSRPRTRSLSFQRVGGRNSRPSGRTPFPAQLPPSTEQSFGFVGVNHTPLNSRERGTGGNQEFATKERIIKSIINHRDTPRFKLGVVAIYPNQIAALPRRSPQLSARRFERLERNPSDLNRRKKDGGIQPFAPTSSARTSIFQPFSAIAATWDLYLPVFLAFHVLML